MVDGPKLWDRIYETVYGPIEKWPLRSLGFFALWLGAGFWLRYKPGISEKPEALFITLFTLALIVPGAGVLLCLHRILVVREPPSSLKDPGALENIKQSFVGRDEDTANLATVILNSHQVWLNGDSGVGKSALLQKAILPELARRKIDVIYLNFWRGDWEESPALAVLEKLGKHPRQNIFEALESALNSFCGVIILDQFDEFQIQHRDKFVSPTGHVISRSDLESRNRFYRILNAAIRDRRVRCVLVTRRDVAWGKRPVLLEGAEEILLRRLARDVVETEISRIIPSEAVQHPENGWFELRAELCDDLADDGVLPVQMRFAVLGLEELSHSLTKVAYLRLGGLNGLVSGYLEREVRRVSGDRALSADILSLLNPYI